MRQHTTRRRISAPPLAAGVACRGCPDDASEVPSELRLVVEADQRRDVGGALAVNPACPGFTATALNNFQSIRTVEQAARLALLGPEGPTGSFSNEDGLVAW